MTMSLRDVPDDQFFCLVGADRHDWVPYQKPRRYEQWGIRVNKRCSRCGKETILIFDRRGVLAARYYTKPDNHIKITVPYNADDVRVEYARRLNQQMRG